MLLFKAYVVVSDWGGGGWGGRKIFKITITLIGLSKTSDIESIFIYTRFQPFPISDL